MYYIYACMYVYTYIIYLVNFYPFINIQYIYMFTH